MSDSHEQKEFNWTGPTGAWLREQSTASPAELFVREATNIRVSNRIFGPPFSPYDYARAMGVVVEEMKALPVDGFLIRNPNGSFLVKLKGDVSHPRKNFTLAHELAHTFYYDALLAHSPRFRGNEGSDPEEEALCNIGARELLMPRDIFHKDLLNSRYNGAVTPITLIKLARLYEVSMQAVMVRCVSILRDVCCVLWQRKGPAINCSWIAPKRMAPLALCQTGQSSVERAFCERGEVNSVDKFFTPKGATSGIRRETSSLLLRTGSVLSVLAPLAPTRAATRAG